MYGIVANVLILGIGLLGLAITGCDKKEPEVDVPEAMEEQAPKEISSGPLQKAGVKPLEDVDAIVDDAAKALEKRIQEKEDTNEQKTQ